jgi:excisionase family DNA binding protein
MTIDEAKRRGVLTARETALLLGMSERAIRARIAEGVLPSIRLGRRVLVPTPMLLRMLGEEGDRVEDACES